MDISELAQDTTIVSIKHPKTGAEIGIYVEVRSPESDEVKAVHRAWQNRTLQSRGKSIDADTVEQQAFDVLIAAIASWEWADELDWAGEKPDNTEAFKRKVIESKAGAFIANQIDQALGEEANFFGNSAKT